MWISDTPMCTPAHLSTAEMHSKFTTFTFLQGQAIYQILHILVSITQPIVRSSYFSRFIWPSRGGRAFLPNSLSSERDRSTDAASPAATDGHRETVRLLETELRVSLLISVLLSSLFVSVHHPARSFLRLASSVWSFTVMKSPLSCCLTLYPSAGPLFPSPRLSWSLRPFLHLTPSPSISLCGRVVINPDFIAGEFLSPCRADSSPRSKTLLGPNPILPPSITPSLPPSGPDYWESGRVALWGGGGGTLEGGITPLHPRRGEG